MPNFSALPSGMSKFFPRHGWTKNAAGSRQLRLPIIRLYQLETPQHEVYARNHLAGVWLQCHSPHASVRMLSVCLRDLSSEVRTIIPILEADWFNAPPSDERNRLLTQYHESLERSEVLLVSAFVLLRRLADQIIDATRPLLFVDWQSAPRQMKTAIGAAKTSSLNVLKPQCDVARLETALLNRTQWFEDLRQDDGIRDILVHKEHIFRVSAQGSRSPCEDNFSWRVTADLTRMKGGQIRNVDVLPVLRRCLHGLCEFMEDVYRSLKDDGDYQNGDAIFLTGNDEDITEFWPPILRDEGTDG